MEKRMNDIRDKNVFLKVNQSYFPLFSHFFLLLAVALFLSMSVSAGGVSVEDGGLNVSKNLTVNGGSYFVGTVYLSNPLVNLSSGAALKFADGVGGLNSKFIQTGYVRGGFLEFVGSICVILNY